MRRTIVEPPRRTAHSAVLVGWTAEAAAGTGFTATSERCRTVLAAEPGEAEAEAALRRHRAGGRPPVESTRPRRRAPPAGAARTVEEPSEHSGHGHILVGWVHHDGEAATHTPVYERCGRAGESAGSDEDAERWLRRHRRGCRPPAGPRPPA